MTIIDQLEKTVTLAVLEDSDSVAHISLLEQFYAILITRLSVPEVYTQLLRSDQSLTGQQGSMLFEQIWQQPSQRQLLLQELATTHHIDRATTEQLVTNAVPLVYLELKNQAKGQFLPAFLQQQQTVVRPYLPMWAATVLITDDAVITNTAMPATDNTSVPVSVLMPQETAMLNSNMDITLSDEPNNSTIMDDEFSDNIYVNPAAYRHSQTETNVRTRNQRSDLIVRLLLLIIALTALALLWFLVVKPNYMTPAEPIVVETVIPPANVEPVIAMSPVELIVGVDNEGNLSTCTAIVGDTTLQNALSQALTANFNGQTDLCELTVKEGIATNLTVMTVEMLPDVFTLLRSVPFARLQLQDNSLSLAAPDDMLLQRLLIDMRTLLPTTMITTNAPIPLPSNDSDNIDALMNEDGTANPMNGRDDEFNNAPNNNYNSETNMNRQQEYQEADDDNGDSVMPAQSRNIGSRVPAGSMSPSEADELANTEFVSEPAQGGRPVD